MTLIQTSRQAVSSVVSTIDRRLESAIDRIENSRVPAMPYGGSTGTVVLIAFVITASLVTVLELNPFGAVATFAALVFGETVIRVVVVLLAAAAGWFTWTKSRVIEGASKTRAVLVASVMSLVGAGLAVLTGAFDVVAFVLSDVVIQSAVTVASLTAAWLTWTRSRLITEARQTRAWLTTIVTGSIAGGLAIATGIINPLAIWATLVADVVMTGAVAGFATVTGLVSAASGRILGAGKKGSAAAGAVGMASGGVIAAAAVPAGAGVFALFLTVMFKNLLPVAVFGAAIVFFITDSLANIGEFSASVAFAIRITTVGALAYIAAGTVGGMDLPLLWGGFVG